LHRGKDPPAILQVKPLENATEFVEQSHPGGIARAGLDGIKLSFGDADRVVRYQGV
jgi:hypothetical protein